MLKKTFILVLLSALLIALSGGFAQATTVTIATFADPAVDGSTPLFDINLDSMHIIGGWDSSNLDLDILGTPYYNATFEMPAVEIIGGGDPLLGCETGPGSINFFDDLGTPLIQIAFEKAHLTPFGFGAIDWFYADEVSISGSEIGGSLAEEASFSFSFVNQVPIDGDWDNGFTATAAFTSSAVPEPATIGLLGLGSLVLLRKRHK